MIKSLKTITCFLESSASCTNSPNYLGEETALVNIMKEFFKVTDLDKVLKYTLDFPAVNTEKVYLSDMTGRILADNIVSDIDLPDFSRSTMDVYAVRGSSTF